MNNYEKEKAKEMLDLINQYINAKDKKDINKKLNKLSDELYYKNQSKLSQKMIDIALAVHSFTQAGMQANYFQPLDEFVADLKEVID